MQLCSDWKTSTYPTGAGSGGAANTLYKFIVPFFLKYKYLFIYLYRKIRGCVCTRPFLSLLNGHTQREDTMCRIFTEKQFNCLKGGWIDGWMGRRWWLWPGDKPHSIPDVRYNTPWRLEFWAAAPVWPSHRDRRGSHYYITQSIRVYNKYSGLYFFFHLILFFGRVKQGEKKKNDNKKGGYCRCRAVTQRERQTHSCNNLVFIPPSTHTHPTVSVFFSFLFSSI